jgi:hypothetical protein
MDISTSSFFTAKENIGQVFYNSTSDAFKVTKLQLLGVNESYNGTLGTGAFDGGGFGTATSAIKFGGANSPGILANTEFYNGTSWTELNDLGIAARYVNLGTVGTSISGLQAGGSTPASSYSVTTQEWAAGTANSTLTAS